MPVVMRTKAKMIMILFLTTSLGNLANVSSLKWQPADCCGDRIWNNRQHSSTYIMWTQLSKLLPLKNQTPSCTLDLNNGTVPNTYRHCMLQKAFRSPQAPNMDPYTGSTYVYMYMYMYGTFFWTPSSSQLEQTLLTGLLSQICDRNGCSLTTLTNLNPSSKKFN